MNDRLSALRRLRSALVARHVLRAALRTWAWLMMAVALAVFCDAIFILPPWARAQAPWVALIILAVMLGRLGLRLFGTTFHRTASILEAEGFSSGTTLSHAVELSTLACREPLSLFFRDRAVLRGMACASGIAAGRFAVAGLAGSRRFLLAAALVLGVSINLFPEVYDAVLPRYLDPEGDHPPYSRFTFELTCTPQEVLYGEGCTLDARVNGGTPERLFLVVQEEGATQQSTMFLRPDGSFTQTLGNLRYPVTCWVTDGRGRSVRTRIAIRYTPRISNMAVVQRFPAYTRLPDKTISSLKSDELSIPAGTELTLTIDSNRPLSGGIMTVIPLSNAAETSIPLEPVPGMPSMLQVRWQPAEHAAFSIVIRDTDGLSSTDPCGGRMTLIPDRRPRITVLEPGRHAVATPESVIPIMVAADDDYGIDAVLHFRSHNGSTERSVALATRPNPTIANVRSETAFDLQDLGVQPGDRIDYFFQATDACPDGAHLVTSRLYTLAIISMKEYQAIQRRNRMKKELFERELAMTRELRRIAERLHAMKKKKDETPESEWSSPAFGQAMQKEMQAAAADLERASQRAGEYLDSPDWFDIDASFKQSTGEQLKRLESMLALAKKASQGGGVPAVQAIDELADMAGACQADLDKEIETPALRLREVVMLLAEAQRFAALAVHQQEIARLTLRYSEATPENSSLNDMECAEYATGEAVIAERLGEVLQRIPYLLAALPEDAAYKDLRETTQQFLDAAAELGIQQAVENAKAAFEKADPKEGYLLAAEAADRMMRLVRITTPMPGQGQDCLSFQPTLSNGMGNSIQQILAAMSGNNGASGDGYSIAGDDMALYGPDPQDAPSGGGGMGDRDDAASGNAPPLHVDASAKDDTDAQGTNLSTTVHPQEGVRYPLRFRALVGEYFRAVMDAEEEHHHE